MKRVEDLLTFVWRDAFVANPGGIGGLMPAHGVVYQFGNVDQVDLVVSELNRQQRVLVHLGRKGPESLLREQRTLPQSFPPAQRSRGATDPRYTTEFAVPGQFDSNDSCGSSSW